MIRTGVLILLLGSTAGAQSSPPRRVFFETKWDAHNAVVRLRPAGDTSAAWTFRTARRLNSQTFEIIPEQWDRILSEPATSWTVEARIAKAQLRDGRAFRSAIVGAVVGAAAMITVGATCKDRSADGPSCKIAFLFTPAAAGLGATLGHVAGDMLPVREWQRVSVVR